MKICVISPLGYTGIAYYDHSLCESLSELKLNVTLITTEKRIVSPKKISYDIKKLFVNTYGNLSQLKKGINYVLGMSKCIYFIIKGRFKIVHFQILELPEVDLLVFSIIKIFKRKIIFTPHDIHSFKSSGNKIMDTLYHLSDHIVVHNKANQDLLIKDLGINQNKISVIPHGNYDYFLKNNISMSEAKQAIKFSESKKLILLFGNIRVGKGIETAIPAIEMMQSNQDAVLMIAGKPSRGFEMDKIKQKIKNNKMKNIILHDHFIKDEMVEFYYKAADIVLVPYEYGYESGVLRFAFSCGCPIVVSDLKEFSEIVKDKENCVIFKSGDSKDLRTKIELLFNDKEMIKKIARNAKNLSDKELSWKKIAQKTKLIYSVTN